jgi:RNA polymerase sigma factor (sigma-70 family)
MATADLAYALAGRARNMTDLLTEISDGDPAAWDEILRRYSGLVSATVRSFRLQEADALDAMQTTWLRLAENTHQIRDPERLGTWLVTTARRECPHILRDIKRGPNLVDMVRETVTNPSANPEQRTINVHTRRTLWKLVDELSPRHRAVLRTLFVDNRCPYDTVARATGIAVGGIGPTRTRALQQLRKKLVNTNYVPSYRKVTDTKKVLADERFPAGCGAVRHTWADHRVDRLVNYWRADAPRQLLPPPSLRTDDRHGFHLGYRRAGARRAARGAQRSPSFTASDTASYRDASAHATQRAATSVAAVAAAGTNHPRRIRASILAITRHTELRPQSRRSSARRPPCE